MIFALSSCEEKSVQIDYTELGIPTESSFATGSNASCPWDIAHYDGKLFVGSGDYDKNAGPINIFYYDYKDCKWKSSGTIADEEVSRFRIIDGYLTAPGIDPKGEWEFGNFYKYNPESERFSEIRSIPGGIHVFDMAEWNGKIFAGLGVNFGEYPVAISYDGGKSFEQVLFYKDGVPLDTSIFTNYSRVYNIIVYKNEIYAAYRYNIGDKGIHEFYKYDGEKFVYYSDFMGKLEYLKIGYNPIHSRAEYKDTLYLATGTLYTTTDLINYEKIELANTTYVTDLYESENTLYALGYLENEDGTFRISVHKNTGKGFIEILNFKYSLPSMSFAYSDDNFYFGMGKIDSGNDKNGMILSVKYK